MRILLLGEFSNVHHQLALGLRSLGHDVTVASDGDGWKNFPRDIDLRRPSLRLLPSLRYLCRLPYLLQQMKGYDVVQVINPIFLPLKASWHRPIYRYLRRHNGSVFMGAFGMDYYYIDACFDRHTFRYSDFWKADGSYRDFEGADAFLRDWRDGEKGRLNQWMAQDCDGIIAGLYEYYAAYRKYFSDALTFIPFPIVPRPLPITRKANDPVRFFIGIQKARHLYKGTDVMLAALERLQREMPTRVEVLKAESVPFATYVQLFEQADVLLDQLYSYTPGMNALEAMARGLIAVTGAEPEHYALMGDTDLHPIVHVLPDEESVYQALRELALHPEQIAQRRRDSLAYMERYHDAQKVAQQYVDFWQRRIKLQ